MATLVLLAPTVLDPQAGFSMNDCGLQGDADIVKSKLSIFPKLALESSTIGITPMHWAARFGRTDVMEVLMKYGANINATSKSRYTPLHWAVLAGQEDDCLEWMLNNGADWNIRTVSFSDFQCQIESNLISPVVLLSQSEGMTAEMLAHSEGKDEAAQVLCKRRVQQYQLRAQAFLLGTHRRLGRNSVVSMLSFDEVWLIVQEVVNHGELA
eukprot:c19288_g1_i2.p1 GENE.c19288_g1_i2~~c19288_g1_i2.p1  ORF type:complete len:222 (+),score=33.71 c19288_g1_i2:35-667(+)